MEKEKRRRSWLERIRRLVTSSSSEPKQKKPDEAPEKRGKSKRWLPGKKLRRTQTSSFALPAPDQRVVVRQAEDEQSKHAVAVAIAAAAAADAAVAAAHAAAEVVRLAGSRSRQHEQAAVAIQSAYRGYLARRALRALKGLVRLQALIRGQAVRRQAAATLRGLESLFKIQARLHPDLLTRRGGRELYAAAVHEGPGGGGKGGWDSSIFSKEEMSAMVRSREEAALKRVRALQYASIQNEKLGIRRPPTSSRDEMVDAQRWSWLEEWVGSQHQHHHQPPFDKDIPVAHQSPYRLGCSARRSFVRPRRTPPRAAGDPTYCYDDDSSAAFPGYMASTASAKAKFRSMSTPKERSSSDDAYSELCFPFADRLLSPIPSIASDMGFARSTRPPAAAQRSPRVALKGPMTPARTRSRRSLGHYSFGSEAALHQLQVVEHYTPVR